MASSLGEEKRKSLSICSTHRGGLRGRDDAQGFDNPIIKRNEQIVNQLLHSQHGNSECPKTLQVTMQYMLYQTAYAQTASKLSSVSRSETPPSAQYGELGSMERRCCSGAYLMFWILPARCGVIRMMRCSVLRASL